VLRARVERHLNVPLELCVRCLLDASQFLRQSPYTERTERLGEDTHRVVFRWRKLGITKRYPVILRVRREGDNRIVYESTPDSPHPLRMEFSLETREGGETYLRVDAEMEAGLLADLLGKKDFQAFIEDLVDRGLTNLVTKLAENIREEVRGVGVRCTDCLLYERSRSYCYYLARQVEDPENPPCRGEKFVAKIV